MKGRKVGQIEVTVLEMETIVKMTNEGATRRSIAEAINRSINTVWRYQQKFNLI